tara:strand:+ start:8576 stop:10399 length:1824 start_codon:yes stop_codon:yes gene_type:complete
MATRTWVGDVSTAFATAGNWSDNAAPVAGDNIIFNNTSDGNSGNVCLITADTPIYLNITIASNYIGKITTSGTINIRLAGALSVARADCLKFAGATTVTFSGSPSIVTYDGAGEAYTLALVSFTANTSVWNTGRDTTTFNFGSQTFSMIDGVYPKLVYTGTMKAKKIYSDASRTEFNSYGSVDMIDFDGANVESSDYDIYDYTKEFLFEGTLSGIGEYFRFGHTTARFKTLKSSSYGAITFPVTGGASTTFGNNTNKNFYVQYHKLQIEPNDVIDNYWAIPQGLTVECNELVIKDGGRIYGEVGTDNKAASIKCVKRPTIRGDWNFRQITDGVYETIGAISNTPVYHGGTGRQTLTKNALLYGNGMDSVNMLGIGTAGKYLKVNSGATGYEWATVSGGGSGTTTASNTETFTNKTYDANGTGNVLSNIDIGNMTAAVIQLSSETFANNDTTLMTSAAIEDKIGTQVAASVAGNISPLPYERRSLGTGTGKIGVAGNDSSAVAFGYPMPLAGKVKRMSFLFHGASITGGDLNVFRVIKNTDTSGNYYEASVPADALVNKGANGEYLYTFSVDLASSTLSFAAGDLIWVTRHSGVSNLQHCQVVVWIGI